MEQANGTAAAEAPGAPGSYAVLDAPSVLGLRPTGVERLPAALRAAGLLEGLGASDAGVVPAPPYDARRDPATGMLNPDALASYVRRLADAVGPLLARGHVPVVLGGDCSILLGPALAMRRAGHYGLVYLDGHADFYSPATSTTGEAADMALALTTGHGPALLTDVEGRGPLVRETDAALLGYRDGEEAARDGSPDVQASAIHARDETEVRAAGPAPAARHAAAHALRGGAAGLWVHLDADVLDDAVMPAVDYRLPGGLRPAELVTILQELRATGRLVGITVTIFNPALDPGGHLSRELVSILTAGLT